MGGLPAQSTSSTVQKNEYEVHIWSVRIPPYRHTHSEDADLMVPGKLRML
jgi:hypothetical protein